MQLPYWMISLQRAPKIQHCGRDLRGVTLASDACWTENHFSIHWVLLFFHNSVEVVIDEHWLQVPPHSIVIVPPHSQLTLRFLSRSEHHWAHFSCASGRGDEAPIPALSSLGDEGVEMIRTFETIVAGFRKGEVSSSEIFFEVLQRLLLRENTLEVPTKKLHPRLQAALRMIEGNLHRPLYAPEIAEEAGLSQRQLLNLVKALTGRSIVGFIRQRRAERAYQLIVFTSRTIQSIAVEVGIPDLQLFNKTIRTVYGKSPRQIRKQGVSPVGLMHR